MKLADCTPEQRKILLAFRPSIAIDVEHVTMWTDEYGDVWAASGGSAECIAEAPYVDSDVHAWELEYIRSENSFAHPSRR